MITVMILDDRINLSKGILIVSPPSSNLLYELIKVLWLQGIFTQILNLLTIVIFL